MWPGHISYFMRSWSEIDALQLFWSFSWPSASVRSERRDFWRSLIELRAEQVVSDQRISLKRLLLLSCVCVETDGVWSARTNPDAGLRMFSLLFRKKSTVSSWWFLRPAWNEHHILMFTDRNWHFWDNVVEFESLNHDWTGFRETEKNF